MADFLNIRRHALPWQPSREAQGDLVAGIVAERIGDWNERESRWLGSQSTLEKFVVAPDTPVSQEQLTSVMNGRAAAGEDRTVRSRDDVWIAIDDPVLRDGVWQDEFVFWAPPEVADRYRTGDAFERAAIKASMLDGTAAAIHDLTHTNPVAEWTAAGGRRHSEPASGYAAAATIDEGSSGLAVRGFLVGVEGPGGPVVSGSLTELFAGSALDGAERAGLETLARELESRGYVIDVGVPPVGVAEPTVERDAGVPSVAPEEPAVERPPYGRRTIERDDVRGNVPHPVERYRRVLGDERADVLGNSADEEFGHWNGKSPVLLERRLAELGDPFEQINGRAFYAAQKLERERDLAKVTASDPEALRHKQDSLEFQLDELWEQGPQRWMQEERERAAEVLAVRHELAVVREHQIANAVEESIVWPPPHIVAALDPAPERSSPERGRWEGLVDAIERDRFAQETEGFTPEVETPSPAEKRERERHSDAVIDRVRDWRREHAIDTPVSGVVWPRGPELQQDGRAQEMQAAGVEM